MAASVPATALNGTIEGRIFNARSDTLFENARLSLDRDAVVAFSDADGNFRLAPVAVGTGQTVQQDITLLPLTRDSVNTAADTVVKLDQFVVGESREIETAAIAINEQRFAPNVRNVVSTDEFGAVAESNVAEFLCYLPGLTVDLSGGDARTVSIEGAPADSTPVTFGGPSLSTPTGTGRAVEVGFFDLNNISRIEERNLGPAELIVAQKGGSAADVAGGLRSLRPAGGDFGGGLFAEFKVFTDAEAVEPTGDSPRNDTVAVLKPGNVESAVG